MVRRKIDEKNKHQKSDSFVTLEKALQGNISKVRNLSKMWLGVLIVLIYQITNNTLPGVNDGELLYQFKNNEAIQKYLPHLSKQQLDLIDMDFASALCRFVHAEINPVCAIAGGEIGQEIISVISRDRTPINNFFVYDAYETFSGIIERIH